MEKIISFKAVKYEKMYREYYSSANNRQLSLSCFFKADVINKNVKIS